MKQKLLTRGAKKAAKRKLNRKLFETLVVWLLNVASQATGISLGASKQSSSKPKNNLKNWKEMKKANINIQKLRARQKLKSLSFA